MSASDTFLDGDFRVSPVHVTSCPDHALAESFNDNNK